MCKSDSKIKNYDYEYARFVDPDTMILSRNFLQNWSSLACLPTEIVTTNSRT